MGEEVQVRLPAGDWKVVSADQLAALERERDEARQRAERAEAERDQLRRHAAAVEAAIRSLAALKERVMVGEIEIGEFYRVAWNSMPTAAALAADPQPAEAGGE